MALDTGEDETVIKFFSIPPVLNLRQSHVIKQRKMEKGQRLATHMEKERVLDYPIERQLTLRERIVEFIKDAVITGRLKPGERVPEQEIAENFGISRTPIREAFRQLESECFIAVV